MGSPDVQKLNTNGVACSPENHPTPRIKMSKVYAMARASASGKYLRARKKNPIVINQSINLIIIKPMRSLRFHVS